MIFGLGIDLVEVERVERFLRETGERGTRRVFTPAEAGYCRAKARPAEHFAARFAAKEAAFKALGTGWKQGVGWREVEVVRPREGGPPALALHGRFLELARAAGVTGSRLSLSHTRGHALAEVLLLQGPPHRGERVPESAPAGGHPPAGLAPAEEEGRPNFDPAALPRAGKRVYVSPTAVTTGDVQLGDDCSVWHQAVLRGDIHFIRLGRRSNVQDGAVLHVTGGLWPVVIGEEVTVAHGAIVHGAVIGDRSLVGIGAIVLDGAVVGEGSLVAAGCVVAEGTKVPPGSLIAGVPGEVKGKLTTELQQRVAEAAQRYLEYKEEALRGKV